MTPDRKLLDPDEFLVKVAAGQTVLSFRTDQIVFSQGGPADAVFYIQKGKIKITVTSEHGREAVVVALEIIHGAADGPAPPIVFAGPAETLAVRRDAEFPLCIAEGSALADGLPDFSAILHSWLLPRVR